jgi:trans-2,3-dihydro-3-hydroxyanthranilate isomerase
VRIFTPDYEMPFAGHPTLGTAHVLCTFRGGANQLTLEFKAGLVPVVANGDAWTLTAPTPAGPKTTLPEQTPAMIASMLSLQESDFASEPIWVNTGTNQLLVPLKSTDAVRRAAPSPDLQTLWPSKHLARKVAYVFAFDAESDAKAALESHVLARYFFTSQGGTVIEDPGTGSACANLGGWLFAREQGLPARIRVSQGEAVGRHSHLSLEVTQQRAIKVGGHVIELGVAASRFNPLARSARRKITYYPAVFFNLSIKISVGVAIFWHTPPYIFQ